MAKRYFWIKFQMDFFANPVVKKMRKMAGGDTFTLIYIKLELLSVPHGGFIRLSGVEDDYCEELSLLIDEDKDNIQVTCMYLLKYGLLEIVDGHTLFLPAAAENIGSESDSARRMRKLRERETHLLSASQCDTDEVSSQCDANLSQCDASVMSSQCDVNLSHCDGMQSKKDIFGCKYNKASQCDDREDKRRIEKIRIDQNQKDKGLDKSDLIFDFDLENETDFFVFCVVTAFVKLFGREPNKSFIGSLRKLSAAGLQIGDAQAAVLKAAQGKPRSLEPYILTILKDQLAKQQSVDSDEPLADWEKQWLEEVKRRRATQNALDDV